MSEQVPAPDAAPTATTLREGTRSNDSAANGSVWGPRAEPVTAPSSGSAPPVRPPKPDENGSTDFPSVIGRISRVKGSELWADGAGLAGWLAASPEPLAEALARPPFEFAGNGTNILLGTSADQHPVCVVCEVGPSSDEGLGVLLRVAAVQEGGIVIWIAGEMGDAHVAALSWLNRSTSPRFYLVKVTGIRIDGSASAPIFELVARPPRGGGAATAPAADGSAPRPAEGPRRRAEDHIPES